jgi:hypothetical protein
LNHHERIIAVSWNQVKVPAYCSSDVNPMQIVLTQPGECDVLYFKMDNGGSFVWSVLFHQAGQRW